ncbi:response regulator [Chitinophaga deserti]|uniref:response regulator n=1 Tax=Chitinophaga deserti TaxID=2164099 RepID=UPI00130070ED|nr:response regulator [Chitinophaga deserti]
MIIDDSAPIRVLLEVIFKKEYNVVSAQDGLAAMAWLSKGNSVDLIVTDLAMPNINGWELVEYLSESHLYKNIPIMVLSGSINDQSESVTGLFHNVYDVMQKPFNPIELLDRVKAILGKQLQVVA